MLVARAFEAAHVGPAPADGVSRFLAQYEPRLLNHTRPYPGVEAMLAAMERRIRLPIGSNKPQEATDQALEGLGLHWVMQQCGAPTAGPVFVGDSAIDLETALRGGVPAILVRYGFGFRDRLLEELRSEGVIVETVEELARELERRMQA